MKAALAYFVLAAAAAFSELAVLQSAPPADALVRYWGPITAVVTLLLIARGVQVTVTFLKAQLGEKAAKSEVLALGTLITSQHEAIAQQLALVHATVTQRLDDLRDRVTRLEA
jgi:ubiquinone biosynthesis protein UbiJ